MKHALVLLAGVGATAFVFAGETLPPFELADSDGNGFVDQQEAFRAGVERDRFLKYDKTGDARLVRWEYEELERRRMSAPVERLDPD